MVGPDKTYKDPAKADRMGEDTYNRLVGAAARLGGSVQAMPWKIARPYINRFNRATGDEQKQAILAALNARARKYQEEERKRRDNAGAPDTYACTAEHSSCGN